MKRYHGIDLHSSKLSMHSIIEGENGELKRSTMSVYTTELEKSFFPKFSKDDVVCVEAGSCTSWFTQEMRKQECVVVVINPFDFKALYVTGKKTDKIDAKKLAEYVFNRDKLTTDCMNEVHIAQRGVQVLRKKISFYEFVSKELTACKNQLLAILRSKCITCTYEQYSVQRELLYNHARLDDIDRLHLVRFENLIATFYQEKEALRDEICKQGIKEKKAEITLLITIAGVSVFVASCIMADIDTITRFRTAKKLCAYLSSVPKIDASNSSVRVKGLNKHGRKIAFKMILQSLNHGINSNHRFLVYSQKKQQGKSACNVRPALVRRTMVTVFYMLKNNEQYKYVDKKIFEKKVKKINIFSQAA